MEFAWRFDTPNFIQDKTASLRSCQGLIQPHPGLLRVKKRDPSPGIFRAYFQFSSKIKTTYPGVHPPISSLALRSKLGLWWPYQVLGPILGVLTRLTKLDTAHQIWGVKNLSHLLQHGHDQGCFTKTRIFWIGNFFMSKLTRTWISNSWP